MDKPTQLDQVIADIAAGEDDSEMFAWFEQLAARDDSAWQRLALTLRDELTMRAQLSSALDTSARHEIERAVAMNTRARGFSPQRTAAWRWATWSGWSVAAVLTLVVLVLLPLRRVDNPPVDNPVATLAGYTAEQALNQYLAAGTEEGRVVAELPTVMVEAQPMDDGGLEVLYLRQFLERERVNEVYTVATDDIGKTHPVRANVSTLSTSDPSI